MKNSDGYFRIRIRVFWSKLKFFQDQLISAEEKLSDAIGEKNSLNRYLDLIEVPFGIIINGEISNIIDDDICTTPREKEEIVEKKRMTILPMASSTNHLSKSFAGKFEGTINKTIRMNVEWTYLKSILMKISLILSLFECVSTCSFLSLITIIVVIINHNLQFSFFAEKRRLIDNKLAMYLLITNICYDTFWLFIRNFVRFLFI